MAVEKLPKLNFSIPFAMTSALPLDANSYFESLEAAMTAAESAEQAGSSATQYYFGQNIIVVEDNEATLYIIQPDKTLKPVGFDAPAVEDTDTQYQLVKVDNTTFKLQSKPLNGSWSDVGDPISVVYTLTTGAVNGTVKFNGTDVAVAGLKSAAYQESSAFDTAGAAAAAQSVAEDHADTIVGEAKTDLIGTGSATSTTIKGAVQESNTYTDNQIAAKIGSVYKPVGSVNFANLPKTPSKAELGNVYNVNDAFDADARFVAAEVGEHFPAGTNVAVIVENDIYYFDVLSGAVDLTNYYTKTETDQQITTKISSLDKGDSAVENQFVTAVSQTDGVISVTRAAITEAAIPTLSQSKISGLETALSAKIDASAVSQIGKTGNINDATQAEGDYLIINCGTSSDAI